MRLFLISILLFSILACAPRRPAKVDEIGARTHQTYTKSTASNSRVILNDNTRNSHVVVKGDSLYSIGFRYQKDYKTLAAINNINPPYRIYPNQIIKLTGPEPTVVFKPTSSSDGKVQLNPINSNQPLTAITEPLKNNVTTTQPITEPSTEPNTGPISQPKPITQTVEKPKTQPTNTTTQQNIVQQSPEKKPVQKNPTPTKPVPKKPIVATPRNTNLKWMWPTQGKIRSTFLASNPARKGISIGGKEGQAVKATEAGVVVYSGNGLLGYGELIIIKHNDAYLSAYGHNRALKVTEGQSVLRGQTIAELGSSGTNVNNLHFEIRKNGKPVNPLNYVKP